MADDSQIPAHAGAEGLKQLPFDRGLLRLLAARYEELERQRQYFLAGKSNGEALHDLRVATRRLRCLLGGYRRYLQNWEALTSQLRELQQMSNPARDLEVFITLIRQSGPTCAPLIPPLLHQLDDHYAQLRQHLPVAWEHLGPELETMAEMLSPDASDKPLGKVCARQASRHYRRIKKGLKALRKEWDDSLAHRLRINGKRLRYLLEPFIELSEVAQAVTVLKRFQDLLGDYHDSALLQQRLAVWSPAAPIEMAQREALEKLRTRLKKNHLQQRHDIRLSFLLDGRKAFLGKLKTALRDMVH